MAKVQHIIVYWKSASRKPAFIKKEGVKGNRNNNNNGNYGIPGPTGGGGVEKTRFQQTRSTHSGTEEKETLNNKLWQQWYVAEIQNIVVLWKSISRKPALAKKEKVEGET